MMSVMFQPEPSEVTQVVKSRIVDAFAFIIQNSGNADFLRLCDAVTDLEINNPVLYQSMRGHHLMRDILQMLRDETAYRSVRTDMQMRSLR